MPSSQKYNHEREYLAALCHLRNGTLMPFDSMKLKAQDEQEAKSKAEEWAAITIGMIEEKTWLQVLVDGRSIYSKEWGAV